jgi:pimeloyl-ACP methyl ester carboxylesterase
MRTQIVQTPLGLTSVETGGPTDGPPLVFVPGMTYPFDVWTPLFQAAIAAGYCCVRYDLYGRGRSTYDGQALDLDALVNQARAVLESLEIRRPVCVVSLSNSDLLTLRWAVRTPAQVKAMVWLAPTGLDRRNMNPWRRALLRTPGLRTMFELRAPNFATRRMRHHLAALDFETKARVGAIYTTAIESVQNNPDFGRAIASHIAHLPTDARVLADARAASIPTLAIGFGGETDTTPTGLTPFFAALPLLTRVNIADGHHMGLLDQAAAVVPHMLGFFRKGV